MDTPNKLRSLADSLRKTAEMLKERKLKKTASDKEIDYQKVADFLLFFGAGAKK